MLAKGHIALIGGDGAIRKQARSYTRHATPTAMAMAMAHPNPATSHHATATAHANPATSHHPVGASLLAKGHIALIGGGWTIRKQACSYTDGDGDGDGGRKPCDLTPSIL